MTSTIFLRVYGLFLNDKNEILITDEFQLDTAMTKFPGGGLEFGEGPMDCLRREIREEMQQEIEILSHFYTTDYFQPGFFKENSQVVCIYYLARFLPPLNFKISDKAFDFPEMINGAQSFRYVSLSELTGLLTFPTDLKVAEKLCL
ncbi:MAG: NUDIX hydrolase [Bacteroidetes bacterium HGW-Bacteroidetes-21]|jgi:ADP-ribose pyrophosphatase YjhB (NUDIX family)|nr:MAG: NUDIX hydrolase [Bacteroidetes bacterium HGW-Bacteroidetes-21]